MKKKSTPVRRILQVVWILCLSVSAFKLTWPLVVNLLDLDFGGVQIIRSVLNIMFWVLGGCVLSILSLLGTVFLDWIEGDDKISTAITKGVEIFFTLPMYIDIPRSVRKKIYDKKVKIQYQKELKEKQAKEAEEALEKDPLYQKAKKEVDEFLASTRN